jgi:Fe-S-cluster containining protein
MACRGCGVCCTMADPYLDVWVGPADSVPEQLTERRAGYMGELGAWMRRREDGSCGAFDRRKRECTIYERRPQECRNFGPEHPVCKRLLEEPGVA